MSYKNNNRTEKVVHNYRNHKRERKLHQVACRNILSEKKGKEKKEAERKSVERERKTQNFQGPVVISSSLQKKNVEVFFR